MALIATGTTSASTAGGRVHVAADPLRRVPSATLVAGSILLWAAWERPDIALAFVLLGVPFSVVLLVTVPLMRCVVPDRIPEVVRGQPGWLRFAEAFVISEVCGYWGHRISHENALLWRFHRVHHSAPELDWLAPSRRHPLDAVFARSSTTLPVLALGFSVPTVVTFFALKRIQGLWVHANVDLRLGWVERVVATPFFHHWHHTAESGAWDKNYAGSVPAVDWLFGTLHLPDRWPHEYGCDGDVPDRGYIARVLSPWTRRAVGQSARSASVRGRRMQNSVVATRRGRISL